MSTEEDAELKNLVAQTLENKGILPKIRAELRANVFLALEENPSTKETLLKNNELSAFVKIPIGSLILNLIREFLEFFELEFTLSVFDPETKYGKEYNYLSKDNMMKELKIAECKKKCPLLCEVIERVINSSDVRILDNEKILADIRPSDVSGSGDNINVTPSPIGLNSTYIKTKSDVDSLSLCPIEKNKEDESIKEELGSNNISSADSLGDLNLDLNLKSPEQVFVNGNSKNSQPSSPVTVPKDPIEIDLLTFTPVKETKSQDQLKSNTSHSREIKTNEKKETVKSLSVLGDLPPLTPQLDEKNDKINEIKNMIDKWPGLENDEGSSLTSKSSQEQLNEEKSSAQIKSDRSDNSQNVSQKSDKTETGDDFEEDISDLINGHTASDNQLTEDETISKASCTADYLESL